MISIYLDVCCLNRPFDEQTQERVRLETGAVVEILRRVEVGEWVWISSEAVQDEVINLSGVVLTAEPEQKKRTVDFQNLGFHFYDALHLAFAERAAVDIFLTTDNRLLRLAARVSNRLLVRVANPIDWLEEVTNG